MTLEQFCSEGWNDHGRDAAGVFARLPDGVALVLEPAHLAALAGLIVHVSGEHLGRWRDGIALLAQLEASPHFEPASPSARAIGRAKAVLYRCAGDAGAETRALAASRDDSGLPEESDRIRVLAPAAAALLGQGRLAEARADFEECVRLAEYGPEASDPAARALAVTANNVAAELETRATLTDVERSLMLRAAAIARQFWAIAGSWLETERAEYRLAMTHLKAGDSSAALRHATECLRIIDANGKDPGEAFFAREAQARSRLAGGDLSGACRERAAMAALTPAIADADFRSYAEEELAKLDAALAGESWGR